MFTSPEIDVDVAVLAREIALRLDPAVLWDVADAAAYLKCKPRYLTEHYALMKGFPKAVRLPTPGGGKGHPKYFRSEIVAFAKQHQAGKSSKGGRPRNSTQED